MGDDGVEAPPTDERRKTANHFAHYVRIILRIIKELGYVAPM